MDIEDLFSEKATLEETKDDHPMIIPEFDPCSGGDPVLTSSSQL